MNEEIKEESSFSYLKYIKILSVVLVLLALVASAYITLHLGMFTVQEIDISGNTKIKDKEILKRSGLRQGESSIFFFEDSVEKNISMQAGDDDAPDLARRAGPAALIEHLHPHTLALDVVVLVLRALQRDIADLLGGVHVGDGCVPGRAARLPQLVGHGLAEGPHLPQAGKANPARVCAARHLEGARRVGQQIGRALLVDPVELLVQARDALSARALISSGSANRTGHVPDIFML